MFSLLFLAILVTFNEYHFSTLHLVLATLVIIW